jgi:hypothetical protein
VRTIALGRQSYSGEFNLENGPKDCVSGSEAKIYMDGKMGPFPILTLLTWVYRLPEVTELVEIRILHNSQYNVAFIQDAKHEYNYN